MKEMTGVQLESKGSNPAIERLGGLVARLEQALSDNSGKNPEWENRVRNKIVVLKLAMDTIRKHEELPEGMSLKTLAESTEELLKNIKV